MARLAQQGEIAGTITKSAYLGSHMEYGVQLDSIEREIFVVDADVTTPIAAGSVVGVSILPAAATLVPPMTAKGKTRRTVVPTPGIDSISACPR